MANLTKLTPKKRQEFVNHLREMGGNVSRACAAINISRQSFYELRKRDESFAAAWEEAVEYGLDELEQEARRRALHGTEKPVFYRGAECGVIREYSDTLMIFLLKGGRPEKYRERVEHAGHVGVTVVRVPPKQSIEEWQQSTTRKPYP